MSTQPEPATEAQNDDHNAKPIRYELTVEFDRTLHHKKDDADALRKMFGKRSNYIRGLGAGVEKDDITVSLESFDPDSGAVVHVGAEFVKGRIHLSEQIKSAAHRIVNRGYKKATEGDDIPVYNRRYIERALEDPSDRPRGSQSGDKARKWDKAKKTAERLDLEDAPPLGASVHIRTLEGGEQ